MGGRAGNKCKEQVLLRYGKYLNCESKEIILRNGVVGLKMRGNDPGTPANLAGRVSVPFFFTF
jgi:hypothetical protein